MIESPKTLDSTSVELIEKADERISIKFKHVPREYINAIRRLAISEVPTLAIDDVVMIENSSVVHDEAVAHRLGMIPLFTDLKRFVMPQDCDCRSTLGCSKCRVLFVLDAEAVERTRIVTSGELKSEDEFLLFLNTWAVHGIGGLAGALLTGIFAEKRFTPWGDNGLAFGNPAQLYENAVGAFAALAWSVGITALIIKVMDVVWPGGIRVTPKEEEVGLDLSQHGERAYVTE